MKRVARAQQCFELSSLRFVEYSARYDTAVGENEPELRIGIADQEVEISDDAVGVKMRFEFLAPSPYQDEDKRRVEVTARIRVEYTRPNERGQFDRDDADVFARVNGIYNAWPYLREFVQTSLGRLGLPPFELPLLRPGAAAGLAGLVDPPVVNDEDEKVEQNQALE
jgi:hypothetical protein